jgi:hypothetical protein
MAYLIPKFPKGYNAFWARASKDISMFNEIDTAQFKFTRNPKLTSDLERIVYNVAREVALEAKLNYVPVLTGRLRSSIIASLPYSTNSDGSITVDITADVYYASYQHETHKTRKHFVEKPFDDMVDSGIMEERVARGIMSYLGF